MTYLKLFGFGILLALVASLFKIFLYISLVSSSGFMLHWVVVCVLAAVLVRQLGIITVLEAVVVLVVWLLLVLFFDLCLSWPLTSWRVLIVPEFFFSYIFIGLAVLLAHRKRHVQRRQQLAEDH